MSDDAKTNWDIHWILQMLPHRYPFLLVDRVLEIEPGRRLAAIKNVKAKIEEISPGLPSRVLPDGTVSKLTIVPFYDRTGLINETLETLNSALSEEILVTIIVVMLAAGVLSIWQTWQPVTVTDLLWLAAASLFLMSGSLSRWHSFDKAGS